IVGGNRFHLARQPAHPPDPFTICHRVSRELERLGNDNLLRTLLWLVDDRGRVARDDNGSVNLPTRAPAVLIDCYQVGTGAVLIHRQDYFVVYQNGRRAKTVEHVGRTKRYPPSLFAGSGVGNQAKLLEEHVDVRAVSDWTWRGRSVDIL